MLNIQVLDHLLDTQVLSIHGKWRSWNCCSRCHAMVSICHFRIIGMLFIFGRYQGFERPQTLRQQSGIQNVQHAHLLLKLLILLYFRGMNEPWTMAHPK